MLHNPRIESGGKPLNFLDKKMVKKLDCFYKVLGDSTRLSILYILRQDSLCVHEIASEIGISHSLASHQLRVLKNHNLVKSKKRGVECIYSLSDTHVHSLLDIAIEHLKESQNEVRI